MANDAQLYSMVYTDELTKLLNRRCMREMVPDIIKSAAQREINFAFFVFDLDDFKSINDTYGHYAGDKALVHFANLLIRVFKGRGMPIRYAGDEFVGIVIGVNRELALRFGKILLEFINSNPFYMKDKQLPVSCSIGASVFPFDGEDLLTLFEKADEALYLSKREGKGKISVFPKSGKLLTPEKLDSILETPPIIGRDSILQFVDEHISLEGDPKVIPIIFGGPGSGKSRILKYAKDVALEKLKFCITLCGYTFWQSEPYLAILQGLGRLMDESKELKGIIISRLTPTQRELIFSKLKMVDQLEERESQLSPIYSSELFEALGNILIVLRGLGDGAILLDEANLIDKPSLQFLDSVFSEEGGGALHFLTTISATDKNRQDEMILELLEGLKNFARNATFVKKILTPLKLEDLRNLVYKIFDGKLIDKETEHILHRSSKGNPLFIIQLLSLLLETEKIKTLEGEWDMSNVKPEDIPITLEEILQQRVEKMDPDLVRILQIAAVLGDRINVHDLSNFTGINIQRIIDAINIAKKSLIVEESPNQEEFIFSHRVNRVALYQMLSDDERKKFHSRAVKFLESSGEAQDTLLGKLAYHYQLMGDIEKASELLTAYNQNMQSVLISESLRKMLQKKALAKFLLDDKPLTPEQFNACNTFAKWMRVTIQNIKLYPPENVNVQKSIDELYKLISELLEEELEVLGISFTSNTMLCNGQEMPHELANEKLYLEIYSLFRNYGLNGVIFLRDFTKDELMKFLLQFTYKPVQIANRWDEIIESLNLNKIYPDKTVFVAIGEQEITLGHKGRVIAHTVESVSSRQTDEEKNIENIQALLDRFIEEKEDLLEKLNSEEIDTEEIRDLIEILQNLPKESEPLAPDHLTVADSYDEEAKTDEEEFAKEQYADDLSPETEQIAEESVSSAEGYLSDTSLSNLDAFKSKPLVSEHFRSIIQEMTIGTPELIKNATQNFLKQEPHNLTDEFFNAILKLRDDTFRRYSARALANLGGKVLDMFLAKINSDLSKKELIRFFSVADLFTNNQLLIGRVRDIINKRRELDAEIFNFISNSPKGRINLLLIDLEKIVSDNLLHIEILDLIAERRVIESEPYLIKYIKNRYFWEKRPNSTIQIHVCSVLGKFGTNEAIEALIKTAKPQSSFFLSSSKRDEVRAAATKALLELEPTKKINDALEKLENDKSQLIKNVFKAKSEE